MVARRTAYIHGVRRPSVWKLIGLAGIAGVAATGVVIARAERQRRALQPDEVRSRLHDRVTAIGADLAEAPETEAPPFAPVRRTIWSRVKSTLHRRSRREP